MKQVVASLFACALLSLLTASLVLAAPADKPTTQPAAAAYPLTTDVVSGEKLGDHPVIEQIDGREVQFANADNAAKFKAGGEEMQKKMDDAIVAATKDSYPLKTCVVSDEVLGGDMGAPVLYVNRSTNQLVEFCCASCPKKFKAHPDQYLPKLNAAAK